MSETNPNIDALLSELRVFEPPKGFAERALVSDRSIYERAEADPEGFWGDVAQAIDGVFRQTTVADLVVRQQELGPLLIAPETLLSRLN